MLREILSIDANKMAHMISNCPDHASDDPTPVLTWNELTLRLCQASLCSPIALRRADPFSQVTQHRGVTDRTGQDSSLGAALC